MLSECRSIGLSGRFFYDPRVLEHFLGLRPKLFQVLVEIMGITIGDVQSSFSIAALTSGACMALAKALSSFLSGSAGSPAGANMA